jgi:hypothetical protein
MKHVIVIDSKLVFSGGLPGRKQIEGWLKL